MQEIYKIINDLKNEKPNKHISSTDENNFKIKYHKFEIYIHFSDFKISSEIFYKRNLYEKIIIQHSSNSFYKRYFIDNIHLNIKSSSDIKKLFFKSLNDEIEKILE